MRADIERTARPFGVYYRTMDRSPKIPKFRVPESSRKLAGGVIGSASAHTLFVLIVAWSGGEVTGGIHWTAGVAEPLGGGGGGGGARVRYVELQSAGSVAAASTKTEIPIPAPVVKQIMRRASPMDIVERAKRVVLSNGLARGLSGGAHGPAEGSGDGVGSGQGTGIGSANGRETGGSGPGFAPRSKQMLLPPDAPKSVKGLEFKVQFWIDRRGRVTKVGVVPEIEHSAYRKKFIERMLRFRFYPARGSEGAPVDGFLEVMVIP